MKNSTVTIPLEDYEKMKEEIMFLRGVAEDTHVYEISNYPLYTKGYTKDEKIKDQNDEINMLKQEIIELKKKSGTKKVKFWF